MKVQLTPDPRQLVLDFDAPIAKVVELRPSGPRPGMPVHFFDHGDEMFVTRDGELLGFVEHRQYRTLSALLGRMDVAIDAVLGEIDDRSLEIIVTRTMDDRTFRNVVRCARVGADFQLAA